jgi:hypothetical protein
MARLIHSYRSCPTRANRERLAAYLAKHPFALCGATSEQLLFLQQNEFI